MKRVRISLLTAAMLLTSTWVAPVQAATFTTVQPYLTDYKVGFTDGHALLTKAQYDEFEYAGQAVIVTKAGKKDCSTPARDKKSRLPAGIR